MDFVGLFPPSNRHDYMWVVLCQLMSMVHLIPVETTIRASQLAGLYVQEIVQLHGLPDTIVSDRDTKFTSTFWQEVHRMLGAKLLMSTAFHPQMDRASERAICTTAQILHAMVQPDQRDWAEKVPMVEYALNSSISSSMGFVPFELNYGHMPVMMSHMEKGVTLLPLGVETFVQQALENLAMAHDAIIESRIGQTYHANKRKGIAPKFEVGDLVYLSTKNLSMPKGQARKLIPKYIGLMKVMRWHTKSDMYTLNLPDQLKARRVQPMFHVGLLRAHEPNDDIMFPRRDTQAFYDVGNDDETEWVVDELLAHRWKGTQVEFLVRWNLGDTTWEPYTHCKELEALDRYLELQGAVSVRQLPRWTNNGCEGHRLRERPKENPPTNDEEV